MILTPENKAMHCCSAMGLLKLMHFLQNKKFLCIKKCRVYSVTQGGIVEWGIPFLIHELILQPELPLVFGCSAYFDVPILIHPFIGRLCKWCVKSGKRYTAR